MQYIWIIHESYAKSKLKVFFLFFHLYESTFYLLALKKEATRITTCFFKFIQLYKFTCAGNKTLSFIKQAVRSLLLTTKNTVTIMIIDIHILSFCNINYHLNLANNQQCHAFVRLIEPCRVLLIDVDLNQHLAEQQVNWNTVFGRGCSSWLPYSPWNVYAEAKKRRDCFTHNLWSKLDLDSGYDDIWPITSCDL